MSSVSPRRCPLSRKPQTIGTMRFFRCSRCGRIIHELDWDQKDAPDCCHEAMREVEPAPAPEEFAYEISGGFDNNAVSVSWTQANPLWIILRAFTTATFKLIAPNKKSPAVFPLADEDAYVYCGRDKCQKCMYKCKKGFVIYICSSAGELYQLPLEEMARYFRVNS